MTNPQRLRGSPGRTNALRDRALQLIGRGGQLPHDINGTKSRNSRDFGCEGKPSGPD